MSILERIKDNITPGKVLYTPSRRVPFAVERVEAEGVTFLVGASKWKIKVPTECWEGITSYLRDRGWVKIGAIHDTANAGTLEAYLDKYVKRSSSSYVVPVLEKIKIVEVHRSRPARIRLVK